MANNMYTRAGDKGQTTFLGGIVVSKAHLRVATYGTLDELNAWLGVLRSQPDIAPAINQSLITIQKNLFTLGAILANPKNVKSGRPIEFDSKKETQAIEVLIDKISQELPPLTRFILPSGTQTAGFLQVARTVARRAERLYVALAEKEPIDKDQIQYLNRLSSVFFVFARYVNYTAGVKEEVW